MPRTHQDQPANQLAIAKWHKLIADLRSDGNGPDSALKIAASRYPTEYVSYLRAVNSGNPAALKQIDQAMTARSAEGADAAAVTRFEQAVGALITNRGMSRRDAQRELSRSEPQMYRDWVLAQQRQV